MLRRNLPQEDLDAFAARGAALRQSAAEQEQCIPVSYALDNSWTATLWQYVAPASIPPSLLSLSFLFLLPPLVSPLSFFVLWGVDLLRMSPLPRLGFPSHSGLLSDWHFCSRSALCPYCAPYALGLLCCSFGTALHYWFCCFRFSWILSLCAPPLSPFSPAVSCGADLWFSVVSRCCLPSSIWCLVAHCHGPRVSPTGSSLWLLKQQFEALARTSGVCIFFSSGTADVALRLGPEIGISKSNELKTQHETQWFPWHYSANPQKTQPEKAETARRPANPPARFAFRHNYTGKDPR